jgi:hypothetical protein
MPSFTILIEVCKAALFALIIYEKYGKKQTQEVRNQNLIKISLIIEIG